MQRHHLVRSWAAEWATLPPFPWCGKGSSSASTNFPSSLQLIRGCVTFQTGLPYSFVLFPRSWIKSHLLTMGPMGSCPPLCSHLVTLRFGLWGWCFPPHQHDTLDSRWFRPSSGHYANISSERSFPVTRFWSCSPLYPVTVNPLPCFSPLHPLSSAS